MVEQEALLREYLIERFKEYVKTANPFDNIDDDALRMLFNWWKEINSDEVNETLNALLRQDNDNAIKLIKAFTPTISSWGRKESRVFKSGFDHEHCKMLIAVVDGQMLYDLLNSQNIRDNVVFDLDQIPNRDPLSDTNLITIFMCFYERDAANRS